MNANAAGAALMAAFVIYLIAKGRLGIYLGLLTGGAAVTPGVTATPGTSNVIPFSGAGSLLTPGT